MVINKDFFTALMFLVLCVGMYAATYQLPEPMFGQLASSTWPRLILVPLGLLSVVLLIQSQSQPAVARPGRSLLVWMSDNRRPFVCFLLFFLFLLSMPVLGMLLGGVAYVFLTLCVLGGWAPKQLALHGAIAVVMVVGMWAIFNLGLGVILPEGMLLRLR
ncbi:MAG: tripartite tricarboxylate transporter TctB family protein [Pseudomonadota bacterium]